MTSLGLVRIAFGVLVTGWTLSLLPDLLDLFGDRGVAPRPQYHAYTWSLLEIAHDQRAVVCLWSAQLVASLALTVGWHSRISALAVFVCLMSFERGSTLVFNSGDGLLRLEALFLLLAPSGAALSLDRRRLAGSFWSAQVRAPWVLRLMQVQLSMIYIFSVMHKLSGETWRDGTAVSFALQMTDIGNFAVPVWITGNALLMNAITWGALLLETSIGLFVWNRAARPWLLGAGVVMHVSLMLAFAVAFFSLAMFVLYLAFIPPDNASRWVDHARRRWSSRPTPPARSGAPGSR